MIIIDQITINCVGDRSLIKFMLMYNLLFQNNSHIRHYLLFLKLYKLLGAGLLSDTVFRYVCTCVIKDIKLTFYTLHVAVTFIINYSILPCNWI